MGSRCYTITTPCMWPSPGSAKHWPKKTQDSLFSPSTKPHRASFPSSLCLIQMASGQGPIASLLPLSTFYLICSKTGRLGCLGGPGTCVLFGGHSSGARGPWTECPGNPCGAFTEVDDQDQRLSAGHFAACQPPRCLSLSSCFTMAS